MELRPSVLSCVSVRLRGDGLLLAVFRSFGLAGGQTSSLAACRAPGGRWTRAAWREAGVSGPEAGRDAWVPLPLEPFGLRELLSWAEAQGLDRGLPLLEPHPVAVPARDVLEMWRLLSGPGLRDALAVMEE